MPYHLDSANVVTGMLILLCTLAGLDLWRQLAIKSENNAHAEYVSAVKYSDEFWSLGYRIEDLELKLSTQNNRSAAIKNAIESLPYISDSDNNNLLRKHKAASVSDIRDSRIVMHSLLYNDTLLYKIRCESSGNLLRVGLNDFRADSRDECQLFTSTAADSWGPHTLFHLIPYIEGSFALRSLASGLFVKAVPPPMDNYKAPWKLVIGGAVAGAAEIFRFSTDGYLYSPLMGGFFTCASGQMTLGYEGKYGSYNKFVLEAVDSKTAQNSYLLSDLSRKVSPVRICLGIPITSKGTKMDEIRDSPFWNNLFDSFMKSIDWRSNRYVFRFYLGFDKADGLYDTGDAWSDMRTEFESRASYRMKEQLMSEDDIKTVLQTQLTLKLMHFDHLEGSPSQVVSQLMLKAYDDKFDYFYQVNDDTQIVSPNWAPKLVAALAANPSIPNFGVTGPSDTNNDKIFTHSFVHRTHFEVFGHLFPPSFKNWWSDDWISTVYGAAHTFVVSEVQIKHNVGAQKTKGTTRYEVDKAAQLHLEEELRKGYVQVDEWLKKSNLPRLSLP
eukprot:gene27178-35905_t